MNAVDKAMLVCTKRHKIIIRILSYSKFIYRKLNVQAVCFADLFLMNKLREAFFITTK